MAIHDFRGAVETRRPNASIIREDDVMRQGVPATILSVEAAKVVVVAESEFKVSECVKLELRNIVQRYSRIVRGEVRSVQTHRGESTIEFALINRLTPHDVLTLRMQIRKAGKTNWI